MNNKGFTLIELVVVIVILGILAVTAAPKFINLRADAQTSTLHGVKAGMQSASALIYGKSIVKGNHKEGFAINNTVNIDDGGGFNSDGELLVVYGYPIGLPIEFQRLLELDSYYEYKTIGTDFSTFIIYISENAEPTGIDNDCIAIYQASEGPGLSPTYTVNDCI